MNTESRTDDAGLPLAAQLHNDALCDEFEAAWRSGGRPDLLRALADVSGQARAALFRELLELELEFRQAAGALPDAEDYRVRFPEYPAIIAAAFAPSATGQRAGRTLMGPSGTTRPGGARVGSIAVDQTARALQAAGFTIECELGRGGMGVVYRAYEAALGRNVAVKVIRSGGFASEGECLRFQNEAEAVAQLDHPQIVPIFRVGESQGLNYFSMKLISGTSLDRKLAAYSRDLRAAVRLAVTVAEAIQHAHQRGLLHRDLKPANILVDEQGAPHVTDFGLARRIAGDGALTHSGAIVGTPSYMSPEQATGAKGALTTATDVYGLGAILYALLTGRAPHAGSSYVEVLDQVRGCAPESPSKLNPGVPRDLEVICLKCLEKEPERRYASALALADDLRRWLAGQPIAARPVGPLVRARMWCRRHPLPAALAALLLMTLTAGVAGITWKWREAVEERFNFATIDDYLGRMIAESSTEVNPFAHRVTVLQMLDKAAATIGGDFQGRPRVEAAIRERVGRAYLSLGRYAQAEPHLRAAVKLDTALLGRAHPATLSAASALAAWLEGSGQSADAETLLRQNLDACRHALGPEAELTLALENQLGALLRKQGRRTEAEPLLRQCLAARRRVLRPGHPDTLRSVRALCLLCIEANRVAEAEALADEYERGIRCARGPKHPDNVSALANRGLIRLLQGKPAEAEPFYRRAVDEARRILGDEHPDTLAAMREHERVLRLLEAHADP